MRLFTKIVLSSFSIIILTHDMSAQGSMNFGRLDFSTFRQPDKDITFDPIEIEKPLSTNDPVRVHVYNKKNIANGYWIDRINPDGTSNTQSKIESIRGGVQIAVDNATSGNVAPKKNQQGGNSQQRSYYTPSPEFRQRRLNAAKEQARIAAERERKKREKEQWQVNATTAAANIRMQSVTNQRIRQDIYNATEGAEKAQNVGVDVANYQMQGVQFQNRQQRRSKPIDVGSRLRKNKNSMQQKKQQTTVPPIQQMNSTNLQYPVINRAQPNANGYYQLSGRPSQSAIFIMTDNGKVFTGERELTNVEYVQGADVYPEYGKANDGLDRATQASIHIKKDQRIVGHYNANGPSLSTSDSKGFVLDPNSVVTTGKEWSSTDLSMKEALEEFKQKTKNKTRGFTKEELDELLDDTSTNDGTGNGWYY